MKLKRIAFDVYATLVDREEGASKAFEKIAERNGISVDGYDLFEEWHNEVIRIYRSSIIFVSWKEAGRIAIRRLFERFKVRGNF